MPTDSLPTGPMQGLSAETPATADAIQRYFGGQSDLFLEFRRGCRAQFVLDASAGDRMLQHQQREDLRRMGHSLKSVLLTLGLPEASALALELEHSARDPGVDLTPIWRALTDHLLAEARRSR